MPILYARLAASTDYAIPCVAWQNMPENPLFAFDTFERRDSEIISPSYQEPNIFETAVPGQLTVKGNILYRYMGSPFGDGPPSIIEISLWKLQGTAVPIAIEAWTFNIPPTTTQQYLDYDTNNGPLAEYRLMFQSTPIPVVPGEQYMVLFHVPTGNCPQIISSGSTLAYELNVPTMPLLSTDEGGFTWNSSGSGSGGTGGTGTGSSGNGSGTGGSGNGSGTGGSGSGSGTGGSGTGDGQESLSTMWPVALLLAVLFLGGKKSYRA